MRLESIFIANEDEDLRKVIHLFCKSLADHVVFRWHVKCLDGIKNIEAPKLDLIFLGYSMAGTDGVETKAVLDKILTRIYSRRLKIKI